MKTIKRIIIVAVILFVTGFVFSLLFGNVKLLDDIRLFFQRLLSGGREISGQLPGSAGVIIYPGRAEPGRADPGQHFHKTSDYP